MADRLTTPAERAHDYFAREARLKRARRGALIDVFRAAMDDGFVPAVEAWWVLEAEVDAAAYFKARAAGDDHKEGQRQAAVIRGRTRAIVRGETE